MCACVYTYKQTYKELTEKRITSYQIVVPLFANPSTESNVDTLYYVEMFIHKYILHMYVLSISTMASHKSAHAYTNNEHKQTPCTHVRTYYVETI